MGSHPMPGQWRVPTLCLGSDGFPLYAWTVMGCHSMLGLWWVPTPSLDCAISPPQLCCVKGVRVFSCNLPPTLLAEWLRSLMCCSVSGREVGTDSEQKVDPEQRRIFSFCSCWYRTSDLLIVSLMLYHWTISPKDVLYFNCSRVEDIQRLDLKHHLSTTGNYWTAYTLQHEPLLMWQVMRLKARLGSVLTRGKS